MNREEEKEDLFYQTNKFLKKEKPIHETPENLFRNIRNKFVDMFSFSPNSTTSFTLPHKQLKEWDKISDFK